MKRISLFMMITATAVMFTACKKNNNNVDNTTPGQPQMTVQINTTNRSSGIAQKSTANANISWTAGFANPRVVKFEAKQNNTSVEFKSTMDQQIDLMASVAASFGNFTLPAGTYDETELTIQLDKHGAGPALQLEGQFTTATVSVPIKIMVDEMLELKTETQNVVITDNTSFEAVATIDLSTLTAGVTETMLLNADLTGGVIVVSSHSNSAIYHAVVDNLRNRHHHCEFHHHGH